MMVAVLFMAASPVQPRAANAQGVWTGSIRGTVRSEAGTALDGAHVHVLDASTGRVQQARVARGHFLIHGVEIGGPYVVEARHIGYRPQRTPPLQLTLGEPLEIDFVLQHAAIPLDPVRVLGATASAASNTGPNGGATIRDSLLSRLPTPNRNFLDFVPLSPHVSTKVGHQRSGLSAAGANFRFNTYLLNGAEERFVNSNVSTAHLGSSVPIDAVKEYQVLVMPYDVRYGDFAGALINTVTRSGTNELRGSTFAYWRNNQLARGGTPASDSLAYDRWQYGFSLGGPIVRDRVHFFVAPAIERLGSPAAGPFVGQAPGAAPVMPVSDADVARFAEALRGQGMRAGGGGAAKERNALHNLFARVDADLPRWRSRATAFVSDARAERTDFSRADTFYLSSARQTAASSLRLISLGLQTDVAGGAAHNQLLVSHSTDRAEQRPAARQPLVRVLVPGTGGTLVPLAAGAKESAHGPFRQSEALRVRDALTLPLGTRHVLVLGASVEWFRIRPGGIAGGYGVWTFSSLDSLEQGIAERYELRKDLGSATAVLRGTQYAAFLGDEWRPADRLTLTLGLRADALHLGNRAPYNAAVDSIFGRRTDLPPKPRVHVSPRIGFAWRADASGRDVLRGGVGLFTGRPPLAWLHAALTRHGVGTGVLRCGPLPSDNGPPPPFDADYRNPPTSCAAGNGPLTVTRGEVNLLDRNLRLAQALRGSLAWQRRLPWKVQATAELLVTRYASDFVFVNLNLQEPRGVDRFGRVMYGSIGAAGVADESARAPQFAEVIDLRNTSRNYARQLSMRLERTLDRRFAASASYTRSQVRDVQSPSRVNQRGLVTWADARATSGPHDDVERGISLNDLPHRIVVAMTYTAPWERWSTMFSLYYVGESGSPFTYLAYGDRRRGDLNADGSNLNDPIYVPRNAFNPDEIRFDGRSEAAGVDNSDEAQAARVLAQQVAFDRFVESMPCLRRQRGRIVERNSCQNAWSNTTVASVRQTLPIAGRQLEAELGVFNVLNLLHHSWGHYRVSSPSLLQHVGQTSGTVETSQPIFRFDPAQARRTELPRESAFQLQFALRYSF